MGSQARETPHETDGALSDGKKGQAATQGQAQATKLKVEPHKTNGALYGEVKGPGSDAGNNIQ